MLGPRNCSWADRPLGAVERLRDKSISLSALFEEMRRLIGATVKPAHADLRAGDVRDSLADLRLAREVLGYEPIVSFEEGIRRTVDWYRGATASS